MSVGIALRERLRIATRSGRKSEVEKAYGGTYKEVSKQVSAM